MRVPDQTFQGSSISVSTRLFQFRAFGRRVVECPVLVNPGTRQFRLRLLESCLGIEILGLRQRDAFKSVQL